jgi:uncharacterized protein YheU (UPF0270 family)
MNLRGSRRAEEGNSRGVARAHARSNDVSLIVDNDISSLLPEFSLYERQRLDGTDYGFIERRINSRMDFVRRALFMHDDIFVEVDREVQIDAPCLF